MIPEIPRRINRDVHITTLIPTVFTNQNTAKTVHAPKCKRPATKERLGGSARHRHRGASTAVVGRKRALTPWTFSGRVTPIPPDKNVTHKNFSKVSVAPPPYNITEDPGKRFQGLGCSRSNFLESIPVQPNPIQWIGLDWTGLDSKKLGLHRFQGLRSSPGTGRGSCRRAKLH